VSEPGGEGGPGGQVRAEERGGPGVMAAIRCHNGPARAGSGDIARVSAACVRRHRQVERIAAPGHTHQGRLAGVTIRDVVIEGLTAEVTRVEWEAANRPPYPTPPAEIGPRDRLLRELADGLPDGGDGPLTVTRILAAPRSYRETVRLLTPHGNFEFEDAACALFAIGALDDADVDALEPMLGDACAIRRQQVLNRLAADDVAGARAAADRTRPGSEYTGHRDIAAGFADRGDARGFFAGWKSYAATKDRHTMSRLKIRLVEGVARVYGWEAALAVTRDKRIGPTFARHAFSAFGADVDGLRRVLDAQAGVLSELDQLDVLAGAVVEASGRNPERDHPALGGIVDRIIAVDPTTDRATMRARDGLLFYLWPAYGDKVTLDRARKAVRTPNIRRELTRLPRDV
jgi:hypothetical protein